jgi:hypothetical protein
LQAVSQQTPSTQFPLWQSPPFVQVPPSAFAPQLPPAQGFGAAH